MRVARHILVSGRVQGVGFRYFTQSVAAREGIYGWVRNIPDGRVEIQAEGESEAMDRFEHRVRLGPPGASVERVDTDDLVPSHQNLGFLIR
jgi:acylphosphatase